MSPLAARSSLAHAPVARPLLVAVDRADAASARTVKRAPLAADIDRDLRAACRVEAVARLTLGTYAACLLRRRSHRGLGFVRLADYTRERLGLSARAVEEAASVAEKLAHLPRVSAEFRSGALIWTQARLLASVATAGTEASWIRLARTCPIDALSAAVAAHRAPGHDTTADFDDDRIDGEDAAVLRVECSGRIRSLWRRACELASRMAGEPLSAWRAAEAIAAEGIAARPIGVPIADRVTAALFRLVRRGLPRDRRSVDTPVPSVESVREPTHDDPPAVDAQSPLTTAPDITDPHEIDARLVGALHALRTVEPRIGRLLRVLVDHRLYRAFGFRSLDAYVRARLGLSTRKVWALVRIERATRGSSRFASAYEEGRLSWARTLALLPVVDATTADAWLARANTVTVRRLHDEVSWVLDRRDLDGRAASLQPPPADSALGVQIGARFAPPLPVTKTGTDRLEIADGEVRFVGPVSVASLMNDALGIFRTSGEPRWRALERLLVRVISDWEAEAPHRDPVFARDAWRCTVPGCTSRRNLHDHHVRFRSRGGGNERANRTTVCAAHHLHGIHAGIVNVTGTAPSALRWDLPLFSCIGDRYV